ncbi:SDR family NAD(P)-dependent oxidoreductase [Halomonas icarae]|uniref:SDR family oxidoreductase n=1 Tax=Halomonas icarae TaxID=2691040 RepID=A0A7X4VZ50_9GAMM|nr:SDR family oxidoreductase [Halomonas icarae]MDR5903552.1 SDR family NAD(P)-dependent oxidoreductase [Halomonas icarae]NAW12852.1 SDR family oxidoreductase [Halomonas icarae]
MKDLSVIVVGGGAGLGALIAKMAVNEGAAALGIIDLDREAAEAALAPAKARGLPTAFSSCDIRSGSAARAAFTEVAETLGRVDTLVNSAAIFPRKPLLEITDEEWDASNGVNIKGSYHMMVAAVQQMREQTPKGQVRGRIVNITSVDAFKAHPQNAHYAATKAAVVSLTRSFAHEVAPQGILVNSVAPAGMATERAREQGFLDELAKASPLGRGGEPREMAEWVLMAGGPRNTYMTGENIIVSGGYIYA